MFQKQSEQMNEKRSLQVWKRPCRLLSIALLLTLCVSALPQKGWALTISPTTLSFQVVQGGANPPSQTVNVLKNNNRATSWSSGDNATWLSVSPNAGTI